MKKILVKALFVLIPLLLFLILCGIVLTQTDDASVSVMSAVSSNWQRIYEDSNTNDTPSITIFVLSNEATDNKLGKIEYGSIILRCNKGKTSALFSLGYKGLTDIAEHGDVTYNLDQGTNQIKRMEVSMDSKSLGLWSNDKSIPLIKEMIGHHDMIVTIIPYNAEPVTIEFNISGLEESIKPLRQACNW